MAPFQLVVLCVVTITYYMRGTTYRATPFGVSPHCQVPLTTGESVSHGGRVLRRFSGDATSLAPAFRVY